MHSDIGSIDVKLLQAQAKVTQGETFGRLSRRALDKAMREAREWVPVAHVVGHWSYRGADGRRLRQIKVACPICGRTHLHGGTVGKRGLESTGKIRHCADGPWKDQGAPRLYMIFDDTEVAPWEREAGE